MTSKSGIEVPIEGLDHETCRAPISDVNWIFFAKITAAAIDAVAYTMSATKMYFEILAMEAVRQRVLAAII